MYYWPDMTLGSDGTLYAVWNARFGPGPQMDDTGVFLSTSGDQGRTFTVTEISPAPVTYRYPMMEWDTTRWRRRDVAHGVRGRDTAEDRLTLRRLPHPVDGSGQDVEHAHPVER